MEEATERDGVWSSPEVEDAVDVDEVVEEGAVFVPALAGANGGEEGDEGRELFVDGFELATEEGTG